MVGSRFLTEAEYAAGPPLRRGRRGMPDGEAIRGGVRSSASRAAERIMRKDSRPLLVAACRHPVCGGSTIQRWDVG